MSIDTIVVEDITVAEPSATSLQLFLKGDKGDTGQGYTEKGDFSSLTTYIPYDVVTYNGSSYVCILESTGYVPTNETYFQLFAQKGLDGDGAGNVIGPESSAHNDVVLFDGTTGKSIRDSGVTLSDYYNKASDTASSVNVTDTGGYFTGTEAETILQETGRGISYAASPMVVSGGELSEGTSAGTLKVSAVQLLLRTSDNDTAPLKYHSCSATDNIAIPLANTKYHIHISGEPCAVNLSTSSANGTTELGIGVVIKDSSGNVHYSNNGMRLENAAAKLHKRAASLRGYELASGGVISDSGSLGFSISSGIVYSGINRLTSSAFASSSGFNYVYRDGSGGYTFVPSSTVIVTNKYDNGSGTLATVLSNQYSVHFVYMHPDDGDVYIVYGHDSYKLAEAEEVSAPTELPEIISDLGVILGKIIVLENGTSFTTIQSVSTQLFSGSGVTDHGSLAGLSDDDHTQYHNDARANTWLTTKKATGTDINTGTDDTKFVTPKAIANIGVDRYIALTCTTNSDFIGNYGIANTDLVTGRIYKFKFPVATDDTQNARISLDNGTTYTNIYLGSQLLGSAIESDYHSFVYNGTQFQADEMITITNSNGTALKYPDGTLICTSQKTFTSVAITGSWGNVYSSGGSTCIFDNFPVSFISTPLVTYSVKNDGSGGNYWLTSDVDNDASTTSPGGIQPTRGTSGTTNIAAEYMAIGRWK